MGFVDRGGGREAKGASLRRSKKNPGAAAAKKGSAAKQTQQPTARVLPTPPSLTEETPFIDAAVAILARKLETDRSILLERAARESGVGAALTWCGDFERQEALLELCKHHNTSVNKTITNNNNNNDTVVVVPSSGYSNTGTLYCVVGVHVNNVDRMNKKVQESWVENVSSWGKHPEVLGILSGLNLERDSGTHFAQEWLLEQLWGVAGSLQVPLVLHIYHETQVNTGEEQGEENLYNDLTDFNPTVDRAAELLSDLISRTSEENDENNCKKKNPTAIILYNGIGALACSLAMRALVKRLSPSCEEKTTTNNDNSVLPHIYIIATAEGLTKSSNTSSNVEGDDEVGNSSKYKHSYSKVLRNHVDLSQLIIGTGSPWNTPQNIPDEYMRTMPNEPANFSYVASAIYESLKDESKEYSIGIKELCTKSRDNFLRVFFTSGTSIQEEQEQEEEKEKEKDEQIKDGDEKDKNINISMPTKVSTVHFDPLVTTSIEAISVAPDSTRYYLCLKCRRRLFHENSLLTHPPDVAQSHFGARHDRTSHKNSKRLLTTKLNEGASCDSVCFLPVSETLTGDWVIAESDMILNSLNGSVNCGGCGGKLGTTGENINCPCGCMIPGLTARLASSKVEAPITRGGILKNDLDELLLQAAREREELILQEEINAARQGEKSEEGGDKKKKEPKKNVKANNRSNFTHFRNKNFAPKNAPQGNLIIGTTDIDKDQESESDNNIDNEKENNEQEEDIEEDETTTTMLQTGQRKNRKKNSRRKQNEL